MAKKNKYIEELDDELWIKWSCISYGRDRPLEFS
jgi:hypothetical protein